MGRPRNFELLYLLKRIQQSDLIGLVAWLIGSNYFLKFSSDRDAIIMIFYQDIHKPKAMHVSQLNLVNHVIEENPAIVISSISLL